MCLRTTISIAVAAIILVKTLDSSWASDAPPLIDQRPCIESGSLRVSRYLAAKYFKRFSYQLKSRQQRSPTDSEAKAWFALFVAQQLIVAHATTLGYSSRPEVLSVVSHMERYMLTQAAGPFYKALLEREPVLTQHELETLHDKAARSVEGIVARFSVAANAEKCLGTDFDSISTDEQTARIRRCGEREDVEMQEGAFSWPFLPFSEVADAIEAAPSGRWIALLRPGFGEYFVFVSKRKQAPVSAVRSDDNAFRNWVTRMRIRALYQQRKAQLLSLGSFSLDRAVATSFLDYCRHSMSDRYEIPALPQQQLAENILFRHNIGRESIAVSVETFRRHFNEQYVRSAIADLSHLREHCQDMAMEELDFRTAKAEAIDCTPQFAEDRQGFAGFQILDLFEREKLVPQITIERTQVERYYGEHASEFMQPIRIRGLLLEFTTAEDASSWRARTISTGDAIRPPRGSRTNEREIEVGITEPVPGFDVLHSLLFACPEGSTIGPIQNGYSFACFVKERNLVIAPKPLELADATIRGILLRQALDAQELKLALELPENRNAVITSFDLNEQDSESTNPKPE